MTLTTGTLYLGSGGLATTVIRYEILGSNGAYDLSDAITAKGSGNSMRDFAGYTHASPPSAPTKCNTTQSGFIISAIWFDTSGDEDGFIVEWNLDGAGFGETQYENANVTTADYPNFCEEGVTYAVRVASWEGTYANASAWCTDTTPVTGNSNCQ